ncbi:MAG: NADH-quinone oxidoreductase subunit C [Actinomycetota bacterium]|nr:NADH-quinone oxidoreductase subunit C [Actinomycetota bacterium]
MSAHEPGPGQEHELAVRLGEALGDPRAARGSVDHGVLTVDVPPPRWVDALTAARDALGFTFFDWLSAVDEQALGVDVLVHLWSPPARAHLQVRTRLAAGEPRLPSATGVFAGADWYERETYEMFGVLFDGHPRLVPLLLPDGFEGRPLRKDFVLASRVARPWPGAKEPGGEGRRRPPLPPGVPEPGSWGPAAPRGAL